MDVYDYISNHVNVRIQPSNIHGVGLFALRDLEVGDKLFTEWPGESGRYGITQDQLDSLDAGVKAHLYDMFQFGKVNGIWQFNIYLEKDCYWIFKSPSHWINSCSINSEPNIDIDNLTVLKPIKYGNELLTKYGKYQKSNPSRVI